MKAMGHTAGTHSRRSGGGSFDRVMGVLGPLHAGGLAPGRQATSVGVARRRAGRRLSRGRELLAAESKVVMADASDSEHGGSGFEGPAMVETSDRSSTIAVSHLFTTFGVGFVAAGWWP